MFGQPGRACSFCGRDLWDVAHFVSGGPVAICDECIDQASSLITLAGSEDRELFLPPRVSGEELPAEAASAIATAFRIVFGNINDQTAQEDYVEDGREMTDLLAEAARNAPTGNVTTRVERIRFRDAHNADVRFQIGLGGGPHGPLIDGRAIDRDGTWLVSRDTVLRVVSMAGIRPGFRRP